jgi:hypothetical protein
LVGNGIGSSLDELRGSKKVDLIKFHTPIGISGLVYKDGIAKILPKPRTYHLFLSEIDNLTPVKFLETGIYLRLETSNGVILGILQIINKQKDISIQKFSEIIGPVSQIISNVIFVALTSFRNKSIIENMQEELEQAKQEFDQLGEDQAEFDMMDVNSLLQRK